MKSIPFVKTDPLIGMVIRDDLEGLQEAISASLDPVLVQFEGDMSTFAHLAVEHNSVQCLRLLVQPRAEGGAGLDVNLVDVDRTMCLHIAAQNGVLECARVLIQYGSDINAQDSDMCTPAHYAARAGYATLLGLLLDSGANMLVENGLHHQLIHTACRKGHVDCVRLLLRRMKQKGIPIEATVNSQGFNPAMTAAESGKAECMAALLDYQPASIASTPVQTNRSKRMKMTPSPSIRLPPPHRPLAGNVSTSSPAVSSQSSTMCTFADLEDVAANAQRDHFGLVHLSAEIGSSECLAVLVSRGYDIDKQDRNGGTALMSCVDNEEYTGLRLLIMSGAALNIRNAYGDTALHLAASYGSATCVGLLVEAGANSTLVNQHGKRPLDLCPAMKVWRRARRNRRKRRLLNQVSASTTAPPSVTSGTGDITSSETVIEATTDSESEDIDGIEDDTGCVQMLSAAASIPPSLKTICRMCIRQGLHTIFPLKNEDKIKTSLSKLLKSDGDKKTPFRPTYNGGDSEISESLASALEHVPEEVREFLNLRYTGATETEDNAADTSEYDSCGPNKTNNLFTGSSNWA
eukprot:Nk52_evm8s235 gene=Nk52_evmTU8s235